MSDYITRERNLTLLTDYYEYTMVNGYFHAGIQEKIAVFDVFFRRVPENGGFAIYAGLQQIIELINGLSSPMSRLLPSVARWSRYRW